MLQEGTSSAIHTWKKWVLFLLASFVFIPVAHAHVVVNNLSKTDAISMYLQLGFTHILPEGFDHILFILSLFLLNPNLKPVIWQATAFTVAHTITLGLSMYGLISPPSHIIEPIISLSIMYVALENVITDKLRPTRVAVVFSFGLIHGMGFASALSQLGLPKNQFFLSLITFNVGVELGQLTIILAAWFLVGKWFSEKPWYRKRIVIPASLVIAAIALFWTVQRVFFTS
jgi:hypothetical protein